MTTSSAPYLQSYGGDTLWPSVIDSLRGKLSARRIEEITRGTCFIERAPGAVRVAGDLDALRKWINDGRLSLLDATLTRLTNGADELALLPVPSGPLRDPTLTLDRFIRTPANQEALKIARVIAEQEVLPQPPTLVLYAQRAAGKTHLMRGIARALHEGAPAAQVVSMSAHELSLRLVAALRRNDVEHFREPLLHCGLLLLDDLQALAGRSGTQAELARALAWRTRHGLPSLIATSIPPGSDALSEELRVELSAGRSIEIGAPVWETRVAIILDRIAQWYVETRADVASYLASELGLNLARIDAVLTRLMTHPACATGLLDPELVRRILDSDGPVVTSARPQVVLRLVGRHFGVRPADLRAPSRSPRVATPRQLAMYLLRHHCGLSYPDIGQHFRRHHTTAMHACRRIESQRDVNSSLRATILLLEKELLKQSTRSG